MGAVYGRRKRKGDIYMRKGCYWCKHRKELECPFAQWNLKDILKSECVPIEPENLRRRGVGCECGHFRRKRQSDVEREYVIFTKLLKRTI